MKRCIYSFIKNEVIYFIVDIILFSIKVIKLKLKENLNIFSN